MFFTASKIIWALISPANLILLLLLAGMAFRRFRRGFIGAGITLFVILGFFPVGHNLLYLLEATHTRPAQVSGPVAGIIVLGGAIDTGLSAMYKMPITGESTERILEGFVLARRYPDAQLVFSGGEGRLLKSGRTEADVTRDMIDALGFKHRQIIFEDRSRNTMENARFTRELLEPAENERWMIVTSAFHMKRTMAAFEAQGWNPGNLIPWPVDYRTQGRLLILPTRFNVLENLYLSDVALHEYVGWIAYTIAGKSTSRP